MAAHLFAEMTWEELRDLDKRSTVAIVPVGAVEAHGPHLPVGTDVVIAEGMARACAEELEESGLTGLVLPPLWYTAAPFAGNFPGTIGVQADMVTDLLIQIATSLREQEITTLAIANAHLDPVHLSSLHQAVKKAPEDTRIVFLDLSRRRVAARLSEEFQTGACHAGQFEGSIVRAERPDLFRKDVAAKLPPNPSSLSLAIQEGHQSFEDAGGPRAYFGWPAEATAEEGRATLVTLGHLLAEAILDGEIL